MPSLKIEEVGWSNFIPTLMALDLGNYLIRNSAKKIRKCTRSECRKFFTGRNLKAIFCSDECKIEFHRARLKEKHYSRDYMKKGRKEGRYKG